MLYPQLAHRNVCLEAYDQQTIEIYAPTRTDPSLAPDSCETLVIRAPIPAAQLMEILETRCGLTDLRRHTVVMRQWSPEPATQTLHPLRPNVIVVPNPDLIRDDLALLALAGLRGAVATQQGRF
jgi:hypothetical protein